MKIEIAESLTYSYLKHIEGCRIVQTNWRTSGNWEVTTFDKKKAIELFNKLKNTTGLSEIFGQNSFEQLLKQAEIDVLGINTEENTIYGIDVAFHSIGLNYGSKSKTAEVIVKKIFRTILIMQTYFSEYDKFCSYFITPKTSASVFKEIIYLLDIAMPVIENDKVSIKFITNEDFFSKIVDKLDIIGESENDTSELYLRAVKLSSLNNKEKGIRIKSHKTNTSVNIEKRTINNMKIGQFVKFCFNEIYEQNLVSDEELKKLQEINYSKETFGMSREILRHQSISIKDNKGKKRYYAKPEYFGGYYLNSLWYEKHWDQLLIWLDKIEYKI